MRTIFTFVLIFALFTPALWSFSFEPDALDSILNKSWEHYSSNMIAQDGRPLCDRDKDDLDGDGDTDEFLTYSEGAGYVLLRAVYMNDKEVFDKVWDWTFKNLWRKNIFQVYYWGKDEGRDNFWQNLPFDKKDNLFAWRYLDSLDGSKKGGVIYYNWSGEGNLWRDGLDSASDADQDIAGALILAHKLWGSDEKNERRNYLKCAKLILKDIWQKEVKNIAGRYYLLAGDKYSLINGVNLSYFRMAYYSGIFSEVDSEHPWHLLVESSYRILLKCREISLPDENKRQVRAQVNLPPNWIALDENGEVTANPWNRNGYLFGWDAFRVLYQVALHYQLTRDRYAGSYLKDCQLPVYDFGPHYFLKEELNKSGRICAGYKIDGSVTSREGLSRQYPGQNSVYLAYFFTSGDFESAEKIWEGLKESFRSQGYWGFNPYEYYQQNWAWFGLELISGKSFALYSTESQVALK